MRELAPDEIKTLCVKCLELNIVSLKAESFICEDCGYLNEFDGEAIKRKREILYRKVFGENPENPGNN